MNIYDVISSSSFSSCLPFVVSFIRRLRPVSAYSTNPRPSLERYLLPEESFRNCPKANLYSAEVASSVEARSRTERAASFSLAITRKKII
jgi:hypothetical protein